MTEFTPRGPFTALLQTLSDALVNADETTRGRLLELDGQRIAIECTVPPQRLLIEFADGQAHLSEPTGEMPAHTLLRGNALELLAALRDRDAAAQGTGAVISGDTEPLRVLAQVLRNYRPNPLEALGLGDLGAQLSGVASEGMHLLRSVTDSGLRHARAQAASRFVDEQGFAAFLERLTELTLAVDRLEARVDRLPRHNEATDD